MTATAEDGGRAPIKVAIIGGGCAAVAAAFELTRPEHRGKYRVTVYQLGWRLGGKGASGRGPAHRIEEHGLHLWMGYYENAFRLMRQCYAELGRQPSTCPIADWRDAFEPAPLVGVTEQTAEGRWVPWIAKLGQDTGLPGDSYAVPPHWSVAEYVSRLVALVRALFESLDTRAGGGTAGTAPGTGPAPGARPGVAAPEVVLERVSRLLRYGELATLAALVEAGSLLETMVASLPRYPDNLVLRLVDAVAGNARAQLDALVEADIELRRLWTIVDLALAAMRGILRFGLLTDPRGFDALEEYDGREWLLLNGASPRSVNSGYMRGLYDLGFSYEDGDVTRPRASAAQALRSWARAFFTYRGSFFWKMQGGMGDVVFAPFYQVLKGRGVAFEFFHRLENVRLAAGESPYVEALEFDVQAEVRGSREYQPLVDVGRLPCWPSAPLYDQLVDGDRMRAERWDLESHWDRRKVRSRTLRVGDDFDLVVLGVGLGAIPHVCREIVARDARWRAMVDHVKTVATQALQVWLTADMETLGWDHPPAALSGFVEPFDTWADMTHLIAREGWPRPPRALAYFCSVLPDLGGPRDQSRPDYAERQREQVRRNATKFLDGDVGHLWPHAVDASGGFRWHLLTDLDGAGPAGGAERLASQYWVANVNPSDRYTLSLPGTGAYRISPLDETYDNLTITGDWTDCGFNVGCVEAAVMSGRLAAHAISQSPPLEEIVGYDHP